MTKPIKITTVAIEILAELRHEETRSISYYAKKLYKTYSHVNLLVMQLAEFGFVT